MNKKSLGDIQTLFGTTNLRKVRGYSEIVFANCLKLQGHASVSGGGAEEINFLDRSTSTRRWARKLHFETNISSVPDSGIREA